MDYRLKVRRHDRFAAFVLPLLLGNGDTLSLTLENIFPFQLGHCPKDGQHKFPRWGSGVDGFLLGDKFHLFGSQLFYQVQEITGIPGKAADGSTITVSPWRT